MGKGGLCDGYFTCILDVTIRRWQRFIGKDAVLEGEGRTYDELAGEESD